MTENRRLGMNLPSTTDPEGILTYLIAFVIAAGLVFLALFASGVWAA